MKKNSTVNTPVYSSPSTYAPTSLQTAVTTHYNNIEVVETYCTEGLAELPELKCTTSLSIISI